MLNLDSVENRELTQTLAQLLSTISNQVEAKNINYFQGLIDEIKD